MSALPPELRNTATTAQACEMVVKPLTAQVSVPPGMPHHNPQHQQQSSSSSSSPSACSSQQRCSSMSFSDALGSGAVFAERGGRSMVRETADVFVSHAWQDNFSHVLAAILVRAFPCRIFSSRSSLPLCLFSCAPLLSVLTFHSFPFLFFFTGIPGAEQAASGHDGSVVRHGGQEPALLGNTVDRQPAGSVRGVFGGDWAGGVCAGAVEQTVVHWSNLVQL